MGKPPRKILVTALQVCASTDFVAFRFEPVTEQLAVELIVFDDEDAMFQAFSKAGEVTTRSSCLINGSRHAFCFRKSDSACARMYFSSSLVRSLLVSTNTERSAVRGLERHSASNSKAGLVHDGHDYDRDLGRARVVFQLQQNLQPVDGLHEEIQGDGIRLVFRRHFASAFRLGAFQSLIA